MFIKCVTKDKRNVNVSTTNIREIEYKDGNYVRIFYLDNNVISFTYNPNSFSFKTDYILDSKEIDNLIYEINLLV